MKKPLYIMVLYSIQLCYATAPSKGELSHEIVIFRIAGRVPG